MKKMRTFPKPPQYPRPAEERMCPCPICLKCCCRFTPGLEFHYCANLEYNGECECAREVEWIKVSDRTPDDQQIVWTFAPANNKFHWYDTVSIHKYYEIYGHCDGPWWMHQERGGSNHFAEDGHVTQWKPFEYPDPPKEMQDEIQPTQ